MERGAEHVLGLEGNHINARRFLVRLGVEQTALLAGDEHRGFRRVALHFEATLFARELRVVAEHARAQALGERRMPGDFHRRAADLDFALRLVTAAGDCKQFSARENLAHGHLVFRERAGLVGADDRRAAERFDGGEFADDGFSLRHARHADGQDDRHGGGQPLGNRADRERDGGHEHLDGLFAPRDTDDKGGRRQPEDDPQHQPAELRDFFGERRGEFRGRGDEPRDVPRFGAVARGPDDGLALTGGDERAGEGEIAAVGEHGVERERVRVLVDGEGFAGECGFIDLQTFHLHQPQIGGHAVARLEQHHIAGHESLGVDSLRAAIAAHGGLGRDHAGERLDGFPGLGLLEKTENGIEDHDAEDDR